MTKITVPPIRVLGILMMFLLSLQLKAQTTNSATLNWDYSVGCIDYDYDVKQRRFFLESVEDSPCIRVCENAKVNYFIQGSGISNVDWEITGGTLTSVSGAQNQNATVQWGAAGGATIKVIITYADNTTKVYSPCVEILNGPKARFLFYGVDPENREFCLNTPINFNNLSLTNGGTEIIYYNWDFGDGNYSNAFEPTHIYENPGTYLITLTVTNKCNCQSVFKMEVTIVPKANIVISCPGVVCENGDRVTYTANSECGGEWLVKGGTITNQTPNSVEVIWDQVNPEEGFGYVSFLDKCSCPFWTTEKVPVVLRRGIIQGSDTVCIGQQERYSLPQWPTTDFQWELISDTNPSQVILVDQRNEIIIEGLQPGSYTLICKYINTLLGCEGYSEKPIKIVAPVEISGPQEFCSGTPQTYHSSSGAVLQWVLKKGTATILTNSGSTFSYDFPTGGAYVLTGEVDGMCTSTPLSINVTQTPATPTGSITGDAIVCSGVPYTYSYTNTVPNTLLVWEVTGGTIQGDNTGEEITVIFDATEPYTVSVKRRSLNAQACESELLTKNVSEIELNPTITNDDGLGFYCPSSTTSFTADLGGVVPDVMTWEIVSDTNPENSNFGNIIEGVHSANVTVSFNEISTTPDGILRLTVTKCGTTEAFEYPISLVSQPNISIGTISNVCPLNDEIDVPVTATGVVSGTLTFDFGNGNSYGPVSVNSSGIYTIDNLFSNTTAGNISQVLTVTLNSPNGCNYTPTATKNITIYPETSIDISPGYNVVVCPELPFSHTLTVSTSTGITNTASIKWYKSSDPNNPIEIGTTTYTIDNTNQPSPQGTYWVEVVDDNGCTVQSQNIYVSVSCETVDPCGVEFTEEPEVTWEWDCDVITAEVDSDPMPDHIVWHGGSLLTLSSGQNTDEVTFTTHSPGTHQIFVELTYGNCVITKSVTAIKNYEPKLTFTIDCNENAGTYNVTLHNNSTIAAISSSDITYTFEQSGVTLSSGSNQSYPITGLAPGTYEFTLTLEATDKPECSVTETLVLPAMPSTDFTLSDDEFCAEDVILATIDDYDPQNTYQWFFDNTSFYVSENPTRLNFAGSGHHDISLIVTTPQGCTVESTSQGVEITTATFEGNFIPPSIGICEGNPAAPISFMPNGGGTPSSYIWMKGNQQVGTDDTFTPTETGSYWAVLIDADGCQYNGMAENPVNVVVRKRPFVSIDASGTDLCYGESTTLNGIIVNNNLERRWLLNGTAMAAPYGTWSATTPLAVPVNSPATGTYTYTLEVRPQDDTDCDNSFDYTLTVHPQVSVPTLNYSIITCEPYRVGISVSGPAAGNYNWSNGDSGPNTVVTNGGVYQVTYTAPSGCSASASITIPHSVDRYLWIFPEGCFNVCMFDEPTPYILGPLGTFSNHKWLVNGNTVQSGGLGPVGNLPVTQAGTYQLELNNEGCVYQSGLAYISPDPKKCQIPDCRLDYGLKEPEYHDGEYWIGGYINNPNSYPMTVTFSSFNGLGTYSPGSVTIPAGGTYSLNPLVFTPNPGVFVVDDFLVIQVVEQECMKLIPIRMKPAAGKSSGSDDGDDSKQSNNMELPTEATLTVAPNPANTIAAASYSLGTQYKTAQSLTVHTINGALLEQISLTASEDTIPLDVSGWAAGTYVITLYADGEAVMQQKLIKK